MNRSLSLRQAAACEKACTPRCRCRCGGKLHGAARVRPEEATEDWFQSLPESDPHHRPTEAERAARKKLSPAARRRAEVRRRQLALFDETPT